MNRDVLQKLLRWKTSPYRKPLLMRGARQTGKTYLLGEFGRAHYERVHYINFEQTPLAADLFRNSLEPARVLQKLATFLRTPIRPTADLLILDEVQTCGEALASLKYFQEQANHYHIAAAGSLLGVKMARPGTFPVGKVDLVDLQPMTFLEFLVGVGESRYYDLLRSIDSIEPLAEPFHNDLCELLRSYYVVGGMPEAVQRFADTRDLAAVRAVQHAILTSYELDFAKHAPPYDIPKLSLLWQSLPLHLGRENKRFLFSTVRPGARARELEDALSWLRDAGLIRLCYCAESVGLPLAAYVRRDIFKAYAMDTGLLTCMANIDPVIVLDRNELFTTYHGAFAENYAAQQLAAVLDHDLTYWKSDSHKAEVDFLWQRRNTVVPVEVKAGVNARGKSLKAFGQRYSPPLLVRTTLLNLRRDGAVLNVPLYALNAVDRLLSLALAEPTE